MVWLKILPSYIMFIPRGTNYKKLPRQYMAINWCQTASQVSLLVGFLISWISLPMKTTKIGTPQIKVISQYALVLLLNGLVVSDIN